MAATGAGASAGAPDAGEADAATRDATPIEAWAAYEKGGAVKPYSYDPAPLGAHEVEVDVYSCGICHTDADLVDDTFGWSSFPMVAGHEMTGTVALVGSAVRSSCLKVGDRVGVGPQRNCCLQCVNCCGGDEHMCARRHDTPDDATYGTRQPIFRGFANRIRVNCNYAFRLPEALDMVTAGPLMCAGATVYAPLRAHVKGSDKVGVIGVGGLGHLALQFARKMGCETVAISRSHHKAASAIEKWGATESIASADEAMMAKHHGTFDFLLCTATATMTWEPYLKLLRNGGKLCLVGAAGTHMDGIPVMLLMMNQLQIIGGAMASRNGIREMLEFAARNGVRVDVDSVIPFSKVNDGLAKVRQGKARYRVILCDDPDVQSDDRVAAAEGSGVV